MSFFSFNAQSFFMVPSPTQMLTKTILDANSDTSLEDMSDGEILANSPPLARPRPPPRPQGDPRLSLRLYKLVSRSAEALRTPPKKQLAAPAPTAYPVQQQAAAAAAKPQTPAAQDGGGAIQGRKPWWVGAKMPGAEAGCEKQAPAGADSRASGTPQQAQQQAGGKGTPKKARVAEGGLESAENSDNLNRHPSTPFIGAAFVPQQQQQAAHAAAAAVAKGKGSSLKALDMKALVTSPLVDVSNRGGQQRGPSASSVHAFASLQAKNW